MARKTNAETLKKVKLPAACFWVTPDSETDGWLWQLENKGCPREQLLPALTLLRLGADSARATSELHLELRRATRSLRRRLRRKDVQLWSSENRAAATWMLQQLDFLRLMTSPSERRALRRWAKANLAATVYRESKPKQYHPEAVAALIRSASHGDDSAEVKANTQTKSRGRDADIAVSESLRGLRRAVIAMTGARDCNIEPPGLRAAFAERAPGLAERFVIQPQPFLLRLVERLGDHHSMP